MNGLHLISKGCASIAVLCAVTAAASAQQGQLTLDDLKRALQSSEQPASAAAEEATEAAAPELPEAPADLAPATSISMADIQRALMSASTHETAKKATEASPEPVVQAAASRPTAPATSPAQADTIYPSDPTKWVCKISLDEAEVADALTEKATERNDGMTRLYFESGDFSVYKSGMVALARSSSALRELVENGDQIAVVGNTDTQGNADANIILSVQRAYNTKACIMEFTGISERDIFLFGYGSVSPILEAPEDSKAGNRRVDVLPLSEYRRRFEATFSELNS